MRNQGYDFIRFIAMSTILLFHFSGRVYDAKHPDFLWPILYFPSGAIAVALFFMLSGSVLIAHYKDTFDIKVFYKRRFLKIFSSQILAFIFCATLFYACGILDTRDKFGLFLVSLGVDFCTLWTKLGVSRPWIVGAWFTSVIMFLYLIFPFLRKIFLNYRLKASFIIYTIFILNMKFQIMSENNGWFSYTNGLAAFWTGMIFNEYKDIIYKNKMFSFYVPLFVCLLLTGNQFVINDFLYVYTFIYALFIYVFLYNIKYSSFFTKFVCKYNFELYLTHNAIYTALIPSVVNYSGSLYQLGIIFIFMNAIVFIVSYHIKGMASMLSEKMLGKTSAT